jgi:hypothetical protein
LRRRKANSTVDRAQSIDTPEAARLTAIATQLAAKTLSDSIIARWVRPQNAKLSRLSH